MFQDIGLMYANRNSTDNIRTVNNPKLSFEGKILGGKSQNDKRGEEGERKRAKERARENLET